MTPDHESASLMTQAPQAKATNERNAGWKVESVNVRRAANGGFIVSCAKTKKGAKGGGQYTSEDYAFGDLGATLNYLKDELSDAAAGAEPQAEPPAEEMAEAQATDAPGVL